MHGLARRQTETEGTGLADLRFRQLLPPSAWDALPATVRRRFSRHLGRGESALYVGRVVHCRTSRAGRLLAQAARLIGAPLPLHHDVDAAAVVAVTEDRAGGGQVWTRLYSRAGGFPQAIHSAKRFAGPTGLEEHIGCGFGIALTVHGDDTGLAFRSDHYFWQCGRFRLRLPAWLMPGALLIRHVDRGEGRFVFSLRLDHGRLGSLIEQDAEFEDAPR